KSQSNSLLKKLTRAAALSIFFKTVKNMGEAVLATKHSFVPPNGCTWKYTQGLRAAWIAQRNVFVRAYRDIFTAFLNNPQCCQQGSQCRRHANR
ncbi:MAG TPA: hypothetical protein VG962_12370, partial [Steroidobacteraceae bacterium]|nr:hypothetical protein [Steroidobacteraceae bacterium]